MIVCDVDTGVDEILISYCSRAGLPSACSSERGSSLFTVESRAHFVSREEFLPISTRPHLKHAEMRNAGKNWML